MTAVPLAAATQIRTRLAAMPAELSEAERRAVRRIAGLAHIHLPAKDRAALGRLIDPLEDALTIGVSPRSTVARNLVLTEPHRRQRAYWAWDEQIWVDLICGDRALEGDRDAVSALAQHLAEIPTPAGPTPTELGNSAFVSLTALRDSLPGSRT